LILMLNISILMTIAAKSQPGNPPVKAYKLNEKIELDGILNENVYKKEPVKRFTQLDPEEGEPSREKTNVWVTYDDKYLYASAYLYDSQPEKIDRQIARRDDFIKSDWFGFFIDTFNDDKTGFFFGVNAAGSRVDGTIYNDENFDTSWDGIWEAETVISDDGWSVEMRIPFNQLRFKSGDNVWGVNFSRVIKRTNEESFYVLVPKKESGFISNFADLTGIKELKSKQRVELFPYVVQKAQYLIHDQNDPFYKGNQYKTSFGLDMKVGVGSNLNLDATIIPDFGQVEVDPAVVNLTAFETFYPEKRPFFIEGANIMRFGQGGSNNNWNFNFQLPNLFYSRRIGGSPHGYAGGDYVDMPNETRILGAGKLSGNIDETLSIAVLDAVTERTYASIADGSNRTKEEVEPLTNYGIFRTQKEFSDGKYDVGVLLTSVNRDLRTDKLKGLMAKSAYTFGADGWAFLDKDETYVITGSAAGSYVAGSKEYMTGVQRASRRYFQSPDAHKYRLDTNRVRMAGWFGRVALNKQKGNFYINAALGAISPSFEYNDLGFQIMADRINGHIVLGYRWYDVGKIFRTRQIYFVNFRTYDFEGRQLSNGFMSFSSLQFLNFSRIQFRVGYFFPGIDKNFTRGGPIIQNPEGYIIGANGNTDEREDFILSAFLNYGGGGSASHFEDIGFKIKWKASSQLTLSVGPAYSQGMNYHQWVGSFEDAAAAATNGRRYVFGELKQKTVSAEIRMNWLFIPDMSLQLYLQPFVSVGNYYNYNYLKRANSYDFRKFGNDNSTINYSESSGKYTVDPDGEGSAESISFYDPDFNFKSMRVNLVFRWEFVPGSLLYLVWSREQINLNNPGKYEFSRDFGNLWKAESDNIFLAKINYWLDI